MLVYSGHIENAEKLKLSPKQRQIDKISELYDFEFNDTGVIVRKASGIGHGKQISLKPLHQPAEYKCSIHLPTDNTMIPVDQFTNAKHCLPKVTPRLMKFQGDTEEVEATDSEGDDITIDNEEVSETLEDKSKTEPSLEDDIRMEGSLYLCPVRGCVCVFKSIDRLRQHKQGRMCKIRLRKRSATGELKYKWFTQWQLNAELLQAGRKNPYLMTHKEELQPIELPVEIPPKDTKLEEVYDQGYALPKTRKVTRFAKEVIAFVEEKFFEGQASKQKYRPEIIEHMMQTEKINGQLRIKSADWISATQINGICSRIVAGLKDQKKKKTEISDEDEEEASADLANQAQEQIKNDLFDHLQSTHGDGWTVHPFTVSDLFNANS